jgi:uncharacterized repeat protein (TIGR03803 family)
MSLSRKISALATVAALSLAAFSASAQTYSVVYNFTYQGWRPWAALIQDQNGNLWGTTWSAKSNFDSGTVYSLNPTTGVGTVVHNFGENSFPSGLLDKNGIFWGTTSTEVFQLNPGTGRVKTVHVFKYADGPSGGLMQDTNGNIWGTAGDTVFELTPNAKGTMWTYRVVHSFCTPNCTDGVPSGGLMQDASGNIWGTTLTGGANSNCFGGANGCGTVFEIAANGTYSVVYSFGASSTDGADPKGPLMQDSNGNIWGTTVYGGGGNCTNQNYNPGCGTVFEIAANGTYSVVHGFAGGTTDGIQPNGGLIQDTNGNVWGTTAAGGPGGNGTVFEIAANGTYSVVHSYGGAGGATPEAGLMQDTNGNLWGTTAAGGVPPNYGYGTVFEITP